MTNHTPSPWQYLDGSILSHCVNDYGNFHIAQIQKGEVMTPQDNAHLIAAAPDLLALLKEYCTAFESGASHNTYAKAKSLINEIEKAIT